MVFNKTQNRRVRVIAIDGPAASGKSSVGKRLAESLGYRYLDTGVMYRAVTWSVLENGLNPDDEFSVTKVAEGLQISITVPTIQDNRDSDVLVNGQDITRKLRDPKIAENVSKVSAYQGVRRAMTDLQRQIAARGEIVMVGRDIGTVVLPDADLKIFLIASAKVRAQRRHLEEISRGQKIEFEKVYESITNRDKYDSNRKIAPLVPAEDAIQICTDEKSVEKVIQEIMQLIQSIEIKN